MIVRPVPTLWQIFFDFKRSVLALTYRQVIAIGCLSAVIVWLHDFRPGFLAVFSGAPFALLGIALSVFLTFRNRSCYERWWEGRQAWGQLVYTVRNIMRETLIIPKESRDKILTLLMAYTQSLVVQVRTGCDDHKVLAILPAAYLPRYQQATNRPDALLMIIGDELAALYHEKKITDIVYQTLDRSFSDVAHVQATCERIHSTPVPYGYTLLLHRTAYTFCFLLPFGFANTLGWFTPFVSAFAAYTFFGWDALGGELEDPFGTQMNALPIAAMADSIEIGLREGLGQTPLPPFPQKNADDILL